MLKLVSLADGITLINACLGLLAIVFSISHEIWWSFSSMLLAIIADGLDGMIARKRGIGKLGDYLEAMADMISLCVAPAVFIFIVYTDDIFSSWYSTIGCVAILLLFLSLGMIRLSSFHILKETWFVGVPASASAIIIITLGLFKLPLGVIVLVILGVSLLMISPIRFPKMNVKTNSIAGILIILSIIFGMSTTLWVVFPVLLLVAVVIYMIGGSLYLLRKQ
jgi:archaetidylserine synthase